MPNPKVGTVTRDVATAVKNAKAGQVRYRNDKAGNIQTSIGNVSFSSQQLAENLAALVDAIVKQKPAAAKGTFIKKIEFEEAIVLIAHGGEMVFISKEETEPEALRQIRDIIDDRCYNLGWRRKGDLL